MTKVYFHKGKFNVSYGTARVGGCDVLGADFDPSTGLLVSFTEGYRMFVPEGRCQATWRTGDETDRSTGGTVG